MIPTSLLATKFTIPAARSRRVERLGLQAALNEGLQAGCRLILVTAPAGFGKTSLVVDWVNALQRHPQPGHPPALVAWLSLDSQDNDPARLVAYLSAALQRVDLDLGQEPPALFQLPLASGPAAPIEGFLTGLVNRLAQSLQPVLLVLDDYHHITAEPVHQALSFLIEHFPAQARLVLLSRMEPPVSLSRLRARNQVVELRAAHLRFTPAEAGEFLNQVMRLDLTPAEVDTLETQTEGWITGLQLAATGLQLASAGLHPLPPEGLAENRAERFLAAFTGSKGYILDYLVEEVLRRQPPEIQGFLLQTSILNRLSGPLCDVLTGRDDGQQQLEWLEEANLFVVPLDPERVWYRYHHLFAEFLRGHLRRSPFKIEETRLHRLAGAWFEQQGCLAEAIGHALQAQDFELAAQRIEQIAIRSLAPGEAHTLLDWIDQLPAGVLASRPRLALAKTWALLTTGQIEAMERCLDSLELDGQSFGPEIVGEIAAARSFIAGIRGRPDEAIRLTQEALDGLPVEAAFLRGLIAMNQGIAYDEIGAMELASQAYSQAYRLSQSIDNPMLGLTALSQLADIKILQGQLHEAVQLFQQAIQQGSQPGRLKSLVAVAHLRLGRVLYEWNELEQATAHLRLALEFGQLWESSDITLIASIYLAFIHSLTGETEKRQELVRLAGQAMEGALVSPTGKVVAQAYLARLGLQTGDLAQAQAWIERLAAGSENRPGYLQDLETGVWARLQLAQGQPQAALARLEHQATQARTGERTGNLVELLALQALTLSALGRSEPAQACLAESLALAPGEQYRRTYLDEGQPMLRLLQLAGVDWAGTVPDPHPAPPAPQTGPLVEPLSRRERQVLQLLVDGYTNPEIAAEFYVAVSTVKTHINHIFAKLGVQTRTQAAARARELKLVD